MDQLEKSMSNEMDLPARGKVKEVRDGIVVFVPGGSNYELHLEGKYDGPIGEPIDCVVRAKARKVYTVPSGGNFIVPIVGPLRIIQGRVMRGSDRQLTLKAAIPVTIDLPSNDSAIDLDEGAIANGKMVNATLCSGATFELVGELAGK